MISIIISILLTLGLINNENEYHSKSESEKIQLHQQIDWVDDNDGL
jgi:hypothetical protein